MFKSEVYRVSEIFQILSDNLNPFWGDESESLSRYVMREILDIGLKELMLADPVELTLTEADSLNNTIRRLKKMEPIQYVLGYSYFRERKFIVNNHVLIPRPETEELVDHVLRKVREKPPAVLDVGIGSGCIGISLALETRLDKLVGIDFDPMALEVAEMNAKNHGIDLKILAIDVLNEAIPIDGIDILVSNPPYVLPADIEKMKKNVLNYEPHAALFVPEDDPLIFYNKISEYAWETLNPAGMIFFEINETQGIKVKELLQKTGFQEVELSKDIHGKDRFVFGSKKD